MWIRWLAEFALTSVVAMAADPLKIGVVFRQGSPVPEAVWAPFQEQTESGLRQMLSEPNLQVAWRMEERLAKGEAYDRLVVVRFKGDCSLSTMRPMPHHGPLGATMMADGQILPFIDIDCGRIKATLVRPALWPQATIRPGVFSRALSRVALHEIYHVLSERKVHDREGLFKAEYSPEDLVGPATKQGFAPLEKSAFGAAR